MSFLRSTRTSQPQQPVGVDWGNPITRGLVRLIDFSANPPRCLVTGQVCSLVSTGLEAAVIRLGVGKRNTNTASYWTIPVRTENYRSLSVAWVGQVAASGAVLRDSTLTNGTIISHNGTQWTLRLGGSSNASNYGPFGTALLNTPYSVVATSSATASGFFVNGSVVNEGSAAVSGAGNLTSPWTIHHNGSNVNQGALATGLLLAIWDRGMAVAEARSVSANPWQLFAPERRIWFPEAAAGPVTHATTGVLTGQGSTIVGSATRLGTHATTGALTGQGAVISGAANRFRAFDTTGTLTGQGSVVDGSASRSTGAVTHATTGALTGQGSTITGSAARFRAFGTSGALAGQGSAIVGSANHITIHATTGVLAGQGSVIVGTAARVAPPVTHATTGVLTGQGAVIVGVASGPYVPPTGSDSRFIRNFAA